MECVRLRISKEFDVRMWMVNAMQMAMENEKEIFMPISFDDGKCQWRYNHFVNKLNCTNGKLCSSGKANGKKTKGKTKEHEIAVEKLLSCLISLDDVAGTLCMCKYEWFNLAYNSIMHEHATDFIVWFIIKLLCLPVSVITHSQKYTIEKKNKKWIKKLTRSYRNLVRR